MNKKEFEQQLHAAVRNNDLPTVKDLVTNQNVDVDCTDYGMTALLLSVSKGFTDISKWLIDNGCNINILDVNGHSAFEEAVKQDQVQVVKSMAKQYLDLNQVLKFCKGHTALTYAAERNNIYMVQALVEAGADVNTLNKHGDAALFLCAREGHNGVMEALLKAPIKVDITCGTNKQTPLIISVINENLKTTKLLVEAKSDLEIQDASGWTALWYAVSGGSESIVRQLVKAGADPSIQDPDGSKMIDIAKDNEDDDIIRILNSAG